MALMRSEKPWVEVVGNKFVICEEMIFAVAKKFTDPPM
jgi:hypothetical protein